MIYKTLLIALAACAAQPCFAKESAEVHQAYLEKTHEVAGLVAIGWLCGQAGYTVAPDILPKIVEPVVFQAERDGMSFDDAAAIMSAANDTANREEQATTEGYVHTGDIKAWFAYVDGKCRAYSAQPDYAPYLAAPADRDDAADYAAFSAWAAGLTKAA